jgi:hypothetical protein
MPRSCAIGPRPFPSLFHEFRINQGMTETLREKMFRPIPTRRHGLHMGEQVVAFYEIYRQIGGNRSEHDPPTRHSSQLANSALNMLQGQFAQGGLDNDVKILIVERQVCQATRKDELLPFVQY